MALWAGAGAASPVAAQAVHLEGAVSYSRGTYIFSEATDAWSLTTGLAVTVAPVTLRASVPVWWQNSTLVSTSGTGMIPTGGSSGGAVGRGGGSGMGRRGPIDIPATAYTSGRLAMGDPVVGVTVDVLSRPSVGLSLGLSVKAPVTDTSDFGSGAWDAGASFSLSAPLSGRVLLGIGGSYWRLGDLPTLRLQDVVSGTLSASWLAGGGWVAGATGTVSSAAVSGYDPSGTFGASVGRLTGWGIWSIGADVGFTETSPDVRITASWRVGL